MTLRDWLAQAEAQLSDGPHSDRAKRDAETLLLHVIGKNKAWLMAHAEDDFAGCSAIRYAGLIERRRKGEPIQYITGECEFYGLPFHVTPDVLIPRPETEHLVEKIIELATPGAFNLEEMLEGPQNPGAPSFRRSLPDGWESTNPAPSIRILDVGTGSGAIAIALATKLPNAILTAIDISQSALAIARGNATRNNLAEQIRFLHGDLLAPVAGEHFEIIVSNPPYVPDTDRALISVEVRDHEPHIALFAGHDGLEIYRRLIPAAHAALIPGGYLVFEFGFSQMPDVESHLKNSGFQNIEFTHDLQGIPRVASARRP
ncbi:MAG: peptide chain release factor N(5)-glutamine methyltransferase [Terracidiphilus sp.]